MSDASEEPSSERQGLHDLITLYLEAEESGQTLDRTDWLQRHPEFADDLRRFFADHDRLKQLGAPLREVARPVPAQPPALGETLPFGVRGSGVSLPYRLGYFGDYELQEEI